MKKLLNYFTKTEWALWLSSMIIIIIAFLLSPEKDALSVTSSLIGVTALIFSAKGNPFGQVLMIVFCVMYGIISYIFAYYGEVLTYVFMTGPMAVYALISWLKNPYEGNRAEVKVNKMGRKETILMFALSIIVTLMFYFILKAFGTANLLLSTLSITTSFLAVYMTARRSPFYVLAYAANDIVLIGLWIFASISEPEYISTVVCFAVFLANDIYGFISWRKMERRQNKQN
ncbi:MAG: nicotinamide mononucleotide transporter [Clostridia bacterium]|nr:nicotinamide mononucleotide transporter [Clostridia bacterium]